MQSFMTLSVEHLHVTSHIKHIILPWWPNSNIDCVFIMSRGSLEWIYTLRLPQCQGTLCLKQARYLKVKWLQRYLNHNHLVRKRTLKHLVKLLSLVKCSIIRLQTTWFYVRAPMQSIPVCSEFYLSIKEIYQKLKELVSFLFDQSQGIMSSTNYHVLTIFNVLKDLPKAKSPSKITHNERQTWHSWVFT